MITVDEAWRLVIEHARPLHPRQFRLDEAIGLVLAADVTSQVDVPPYDKALMDGYAVRVDDVTQRDVVLRVIEQVVAGHCPVHPLGAGETTRIMTGAPLPEGADAVVMSEETDPCRTTDERSQLAQIKAFPVHSGQNIMRRGAVMRSGDRVLSANRRLQPVDIGLMAEIGLTCVHAYPRPSAAVLATGNELVDHQVAPANGQIRNSNGPMLTALVRDAGGDPRDLGIARDERDELAERIQDGLQHPVLILSGGVSAGVKDLVPDVLADLGVRGVFHKVRLKPGKPIWFGVFERSADSRTLVFGLPGNPVSSLVCFWLFVRPAIHKLASRQAVFPNARRGKLSTAFSFRGDRETYYPGRQRETDTGANVEPLPWLGSADLHTLSTANCLMRFPAAVREFSPGDEVDFFPLSPFSWE